MKIEASIQQILNQTGKVVIPNFGTFSTAQASASVTDSGGVIAPPQAEISFTEDTSDVGTVSLAEYLVSSGKVSKADIELELEAFINGVQNTVESSGKAGLGALGYFQKGAGGLEFVSSTGTSMGADNFGLPKIAARPLVPVAVTDHTPAPTGKGDNLLLKAILIPLIILSVALAYFLIDKEAYQAMVAYLNKPSTEVNTPPIKDKPDGEANNGKKDDGTGDIVLLDDDKKGSKKTDGTTKVDKPDNSTVKDDGAKKSDNTTTADKSSNTTTGKDDISKATSGVRFYIIIASVKTDKGAQKKVNQCKRLGYKNARVLKMNGKIRVSIDDFADKATALEKAKQLGKDYPGAWPLAHKL